MDMIVYQIKGGNNYPELHCNIVNRIVLGNMVIDYTRISGIQNDSSFDTLEA